MLRCPGGSVGVYRVKLEAIHHDPPYRVQIGAHAPVYLRESDGKAVILNGVPQTIEEAPFVGLGEDYEGELCADELAFLNGEPGRDYRMEYLFTVTKIG